MYMINSLSCLVLQIAVMILRTSAWLGHLFLLDIFSRLLLLLLPLLCFLLTVWQHRRYDPLSIPQSHLLLSPHPLDLLAQFREQLSNFSPQLLSISFNSPSLTSQLLIIRNESRHSSL